MTTKTVDSLRNPPPNSSLPSSGTHIRMYMVFPVTCTVWCMVRISCYVHVRTYVYLPFEERFFDKMAANEQLLSDTSIKENEKERS